MSAGKTIGNIVRATFRGELLLSLRVDKYLGHIMFVFLIAALAIFAYLQMDKTLVRMEKNKVELENLQIFHAQKTSELASFNKMSTVEKMLEKCDSKVGMPEKPADKIKIQN